MRAGTGTILDRVFHRWTDGLDPVAARIAVFERVRNIPYAVLPELIDRERYIDILRLNRGSCTPKHFLLGAMFERLGHLVLFVVYPFRWGERAEVLADYPTALLERARAMPLSHHLACLVEIAGRLVLVDATLDPPLASAGLPVNLHWDGYSDTSLPMTPLGPGELYHKEEAYLMEPRTDEASLAFYAELNARLEQVRQARQRPQE